MSITIPPSLMQLVANRNTSLGWYHSVGVVLNEITPRKRGLAGAAMSQIAEEAFKDDKILPTLYACRRFARVVSKSELPRLDGLNWKHVHYLISVSDKRLRDRLIRRVKAENLTARELEMAIQERLGKRTNGGRKPRLVSLSPKAACRESTRLCDDLVRRLPDWLRNVRNIQADQSDPEKDSLVAATCESLRAAESVIRDELRLLQRRPR